MAAQLRLVIPACRPTPLLGGQSIVGGRIALAPEVVRDRMVPRRDRLAEHYRFPPDPAALPPGLSEQRKRERLQSEMGRHREYLGLAAAVHELEEAIRRGEDLEVTAVLFMARSTAIERWSGMPILARQFVWAECSACGRRYVPEECGQSDWSRVADPRAGIGGSCLVCPAGHVMFAMRTWVA